LAGLRPQIRPEPESDLGQSYYTYVNIGFLQSDSDNTTLTELCTKVKE